MNLSEKNNDENVLRITYLEHVLHESKQLHRESHVFCISMEVDENFGTASQIGEVQARDETKFLLGVLSCFVSPLIVHPADVL